MNKNTICAECGSDVFYDDSRAGYEGWQCQKSASHKKLKCRKNKDKDKYIVDLLTVIQK